MPFFYCPACREEHFTGQRESMTRGRTLWLTDGVAVAEHLGQYIAKLEAGQLSLDSQLGPPRSRAELMSREGLLGDGE